MASFVLGLPGETSRTIEQTLEFAHWVIWKQFQGQSLFLWACPAKGGAY